MKFYAYCPLNQKLPYVSNPNGMKFYSITKLLKKKDIKCFKSQRDEILLSNSIFSSNSEKVSNPNGMKFYLI